MVRAAKQFEWIKAMLTAHDVNVALHPWFTRGNTFEPSLATNLQHYEMNIEYFSGIKPPNSL